MSDPKSAKPEDKIPTPSIQVLPFPTDQIDPSPYQARKHFPQDGIDEMAGSIREHGILQPLIARVADPASGRLELVAGERRWRGAKQAGLREVPVIVRELSAAQAEEIMLIENLQREDLTASEEAHGYDRMLKLQATGGAAIYTVETLAAKLNKSVAHIVARLKLLLCPKEMIAAVDARLVSVNTAMLVGRIPGEQDRARCAEQVLRPETQEVPLNYQQTRELIREKFVVQLNAADFDPAQEGLVPVKMDGGNRVLGGACTDCPYRSGNMDDVELRVAVSGEGKTAGTSRGASPNMCTLPRCHALKMDAAWRVKKRKAQIDGLGTLDGEEAVKAFSGHNGELAYDSGYINLVDVIGYVDLQYHDQTWKEALKDQPVKVILARHPETKQILRLVKKEEAEAKVREIDAQKNAPAQADLGQPKPAEQLREEEAAALRRAEEQRREKLDRIIVNEGVHEVVRHITGKGVTLEFWELIFQMALDYSGADGMYFLGHWFEIQLPKGTNHGGRAFEEDIIRLVKERAETPNAWLAFTVVALISHELRWQGVKGEDFESCLKHIGIKLSELERRAEALLTVEQKGKKRPKEEVSTKGTSTDPVDVSADKESALTAAADALARDQAKEAKVYTRVNDMIQPLLRVQVVPVTEPNEHGVFVDHTAFQFQAGPKVEFTIRLATTGEGSWYDGHQDRTEGLGSMGLPGHLRGGHASRARAVMAAVRTLHHSFSQKTTEYPPAIDKQRGQALQALEKLQEWVGEEIAREASKRAAATDDNAETEGADERAKEPPLTARWSQVAFTEADVKAGAKAIAKGEATITTLIGPKPNVADKESYNGWSRVRMQILRAAKALSKGGQKN